MKRTQYTVIPAQSGTTEKEIAKAKRIFHAGKKTGKYPESINIKIVFSSKNGKVKAKYINIKGETIDKVAIK